MLKLRSNKAIKKQLLALFLKLYHFLFLNITVESLFWYCTTLGTTRIFFCFLKCKYKCYNSVFGSILDCTRHTEGCRGSTKVWKINFCDWLTFVRPTRALLLKTWRPYLTNWQRPTIPLRN